MKVYKQYCLRLNWQLLFEYKVDIEKYLVIYVSYTPSRFKYRMALINYTSEDELSFYTLTIRSYIMVGYNSN